MTNGHVCIWHTPSSFLEGRLEEEATGYDSAACVHIVYTFAAESETVVDVEENGELRLQSISSPQVHTWVHITGVTKVH